MRVLPSPAPDRAAVEPSANAPATPVGAFRWTICALLFFATTVNYADRQILGILAPTLQKEIGWSEAQYGLIVTAFQGAYALGLLGIGRLIDRVGTRLGYSLALGWWSVAAMLHALAASAFGFGCARFLLGLGEAGNFPAAIKTVAEWFPKRERALATGVFNSGSNAGAILAPLLVPWLTIEFGWRWAFAAFGGAGLLWIVAWLLIYREPALHPRLSRAELDYIRSEPAESAGHIPWRVLDRQPPRLGTPPRPLPHRPRVVALSLLGTEVPEFPIRPETRPDRPARWQPRTWSPASAASSADGSTRS